MVMYIGFLLFIGVRTFHTTYINMHFKIGSRSCLEVVKSYIERFFYLIEIQYDGTKFEFHLHIKKCLDYEK